MAFSSLSRSRALSLTIATASVGFSLQVNASMGNLGTTYGVMPVDVATLSPCRCLTTRYPPPITTPLT